jgi:hypothetical protein
MRETIGEAVVSPTHGRRLREAEGLPRWAYALRDPNEALCVASS